MTDWNKVRSRAQRLLDQTTLLTSATWRGKTLRGVRTVLKREAVNTDDGLAGRYAFSLRVPANQFEIGNYPDPLNDKLTIEGKDYRVLSIEGDAIIASILINLGDATA